MVLMVNIFIHIIKPMNCTLKKFVLCAFYHHKKKEENNILYKYHHVNKYCNIKKKDI